MEKFMRLKDKVCIITGGAAGIGKATAEKFYAEGAKVIICDLNQAAGDALVAQLGENAKYYQVNVTDRQAVQAFVDQVVEEFGRVDVLINNAGITKDGQFVKFKEGEKVGEMSEEAFDAVVAVNLKGVFNCTQAVTPYMIKQGGGAITSASSVVGLYGNFGQTNYAATKFGVIGMTKTWARELGKYQIRVNAVAPGFILTEMVLKMPEHVLANMAANAPLKRLGKPEEIANVYCWLSSDEASYIHGAVISADGGIVLGT